LVGGREGLLQPREVQQRGQHAGQAGGRARVRIRRRLAERTGEEAGGEEVEPALADGRGGPADDGERRGGAVIGGRRDRRERGRRVGGDRDRLLRAAVVDDQHRSHGDVGHRGGCEHGGSRRDDGGVGGVDRVAGRGGGVGDLVGGQGQRGGERGGLEEPYVAVAQAADQAERVKVLGRDELPAQAQAL